MNCSNCGKPLLAGSYICPVCGVDNSSQTVAQNNPQVPAPDSSAIVNQTNMVNETLPQEQTPIIQPSEYNALESQPTVTLETQNVAPLNQPPNEVSASASESAPQEPIENLDTTNSVTTTENLGQNGVFSDEFTEIEDEDEEKIAITENMAPPSLNVEEENLTSGAGDLTNEESVSTYSKEAEQEQIEEEKEEQTRQEERVDIAIPSVQSTVEVSMPTDGSAPEMVQDTNTVGDASGNSTTTLESPDKKSKFKISIPKGSKNVPKALMIIVAIIFLVVGILLGKIFFSKNYCSTSSNRSVLSNTKVKYVSDGKNNVTNINGYTYKIPEQYTYDKESGGLLVYSETDTFRIFIKTEKGVYANLSGAKNSIRETLRDNSYTVSQVKELKSNDVEFLVFETTTRMNNRMLAFASASETEIFYLEIVTSNNNYDYDVLDVAADILKNATASEKNTTMESINITDASEISIKAAEEYSNLVNR